MEISKKKDDQIRFGHLLRSHSVHNRLEISETMSRSSPSRSMSGSQFVVSPA